MSIFHTLYKYIQLNIFPLYTLQAQRAASEARLGQILKAEQEEARSQMEALRVLSYSFHIFLGNYLYREEIVTWVRRQKQNTFCHF